ncbi:capsular associated protein, partial [Rhizophlyctis rosea]
MRIRKHSDFKYLTHMACAILFIILLLDPSTPPEPSIPIIKAARKVSSNALRSHRDTSGGAGLAPLTTNSDSKHRKATVWDAADDKHRPIEEVRQYQMDAEGARNATARIWRELIHRLNCGNAEENGEVAGTDDSRVQVAGRAEEKIWKELDELKSAFLRHLFHETILSHEQADEVNARNGDEQSETHQDSSAEGQVGPISNSTADMLSKTLPPEDQTSNTDSTTRNRRSHTHKSLTRARETFLSHILTLTVPTPITTSFKRCTSLRSSIPGLLPNPTCTSPLPTRYRHLSQKQIYIAINFHNNAPTLPETLSQLLRLTSHFHSRQNVFISIYESGSTDRTRALLRNLEAALSGLGIPHYIVGDPSPPPSKSENRITKLARVRNAALQPLYEGTDGRVKLRNGKWTKKFDRIVFLNDVIWCAEDVMELLWQSFLQGGDITCGLDYNFAEGETGGELFFYDTWVSRTILGTPFYGGPWNHFTHHPPTTTRMLRNLPFQAQCCWNGISILRPTPFTHSHIRFRSGQPQNGECAASECSLLCQDFWKAGWGRVVVVPGVRVGYERGVQEGLLRARNEGKWGVDLIERDRRKEARKKAWKRREDDGVNGATKGKKRKKKPKDPPLSDPDSYPYPSENKNPPHQPEYDSSQDLSGILSNTSPNPPHGLYPLENPEKIQYIPGPKTVTCRGLEGTGRDPDQPPVEEYLVIGER